MNIIKEINGLVSAGIGEIKSTKYDQNSKKLYTALNTKYSEAWKMFSSMSGVLYRGKSFSGYILEQIPSLRKSENTSNIYTRLLSDILPSWSKYPKRNKSFICTSNYSKASGYDKNGGLYIILPENGAKIGICPEDDIWDSFHILRNKYDFNLSRFNRAFINYLREKAEKNGFEIDNFADIFVDYSRNEIINFFKKLDKLPTLQIDYNTGTEDYINFKTDIEEYISEGGSLISFLNRILDPVKNNFTYTNSIKDVFTPYPENNEIWVEGACLLLNFTNYKFYNEKEKKSKNEDYKAMYRIISNVMGVMHQNLRYY